MRGRKHRYHMGLLGPGLETVRPCMIQGARQHAGPRIPLLCFHCGATDPMWATNAEQGHCMLCGATFFKAVDTYVPVYPKPPGPRPGSHVGFAR